MAGWSLASSSKVMVDKLMSVLGSTLSSWLGSSAPSPPDVAVRAVYAKAMPVIWAIKGTFRIDEMFDLWSNLPRIFFRDVSLDRPLDIRGPVWGGSEGPGQDHRGSLDTASGKYFSPFYE